MPSLRSLFCNLDVSADVLQIRWAALEDWKRARNKAVKSSEELRLVATEVITNILNNQPGLKERIETAIRRNDVTEMLSDGVIEAIWRGILTGKPEQVHIWKGISLVSTGRVELRFYENDSQTKLGLNDLKLAKEVRNACHWVVNNLQKGNKSDLVQKLADEVRQIKDRTEELEESLDGLILRPMILRTRCDLCPA